jgi:hypothetical protein
MNFQVESLNFRLAGKEDMQLFHPVGKDACSEAAADPQGLYHQP